MDINWLIIFTTCIFAVGTGLYIGETLAGRTQPNRVTWLIWGIAPLIGASATFVSEGFVWSAVPVLVMGIMDLGVVAASFVNRNSYWKLEGLDYFSLMLAFFGLSLWWMTSDPLLAIICAVAVDGIGGILMIKKMYIAPETENIYPFLGLIIANSVALYFVVNWKIEEYLFPLYIVTICLLIVLAFFGKRIVDFLKNKKI